MLRYSFVECIDIGMAGERGLAHQQNHSQGRDAYATRRRSGASPMNMTMLMNTFVHSFTPGTQDRSKPLLRGITAATIARRMRVSTSPSLNMTGIIPFDGKEPYQ